MVENLRWKTTFDGTLTRTLILIYSMFGLSVKWSSAMWTERQVDQMARWPLLSIGWASVVFHLNLALTHCLQCCTACLIQNGRWGLEICQTLGHWIPQKKLLLIFWFNHSFYEYPKNPKSPPVAQNEPWGLERGEPLVFGCSRQLSLNKFLDLTAELFYEKKLWRRRKEKKRRRKEKRIATS